MSCKARPPSGSDSAVAHAGAMHVDQFERTAAEVADDAVRSVNAGDDAERGQVRLARARQHLDRGAADALGLRDEGAAVLGVAAGGGGDRPHPAHVQHVAERAEALERGERDLDRLRRQQPGGLHLAAEAGQHLFVEDRRRRARQPLVDDEPHRVGADVDDRDRRSVVEPALGGGAHARRFTRLRPGGGGGCAARIL